MSAYIEPRFGTVGRVWPVVSEGCHYLFVEETQERLHYTVLYQCNDGLCKKFGEFAVGFPSPLALEVDAMYSTIRFIGYSVAGGLSPLLVIEEDLCHCWFLLYTLEKGYWLLSKEFHMTLTPLDDNEAGGGGVSNTNGSGEPSVS